MNWKSISTSAVLPSSKHLAMVLAMHFNWFQRLPTSGVIMHEVEKSPGQRNKCYLLKGHRLEQTKLCKSCPNKGFLCCQFKPQGECPPIRKWNEIIFSLNHLRFCTKYNDPTFPLWWYLFGILSWQGPDSVYFAVGQKGSWACHYSSDLFLIFGWFLDLLWWAVN